ncbi:MAG: hypothetical protein ACLFPO_12665 [Spirochaetaceae bacterium]
MMNDTDLEALLARHAAFWTREPVDRPLLYIRPWPMEWHPRPWPLAGGREADEPTPIGPDDVDVDRMVAIQGDGESLTKGDLFNAVAPAYPQAWMGALIGCPIHVSSHGCVARPTGEDLETVLARFTVEEALASPWLTVMERMFERGTELARGRFAVEQLHMRGVVDMLAAIFGEAEFCVLLLDEPDRIRELADRFADLIVAVAKRGIDLRGPWRGGYLTRWSIHAPGPMHDYQADASTILSPELYATLLLEFDRKVLSAFDYSLTHIHAAGIHMVEPMLAIRELNAFEINLDRETGVWEKERMLETAKAIQAAGKGLLLWGEFTQDELDEFQTELDPAGLAFHCWLVEKGRPTR